jgi:hypothetical protein
MEGVRRGPPNAVRHHGEEKEEEGNLRDKVYRMKLHTKVKPKET